MPQETNLNVAPYFDDFDPISNYYKVLFKPGYPIQARELNNLQSILQDQVENIGDHFFKEGAKVIPGNTSYYQNFYCIQINPSYAGIPVSEYLDQLVGKKITGRQSNVSATIVTYISDAQSINGKFTLYLNYINSGVDENTSFFVDGEVLNTEENILFADTFISSGEGVCQCIAENANRIGSSFAVSQGIYYLRGTFVDVSDQLLILDQYENTPSYRIGFYVREELISASSDSSLNDNAQGFTNFTAPGADRLKITATLQKKDPDDTDDQNFVQIAEVVNGRLRTLNKQSAYNNSIRDELARRTFDESGHYYVKEFVTTVKESLINASNKGIYSATQTTDSGNTPSTDLGVYKIAPGKAYVKGFEINQRSPVFLDFEKPRTTKTLENQAVNFGFGPSFTLNRVSGTPNIGFNTDYTLSFRNERVGVTSSPLAVNAAGKEIGVARVYDFALESGAYNLTDLNQNQWDLSVYDVQTYIDLTLNENATLTVPTFIEGKSSGATAFIRYPVTAGTAVTAYNVQGDFHIGERIIFDGDNNNGRTAIALTSYGISDFKSVFGITGTANTFTADIIPSVNRVIGIASITPVAPVQGISTVTSPGLKFPGITTVGDLVSFSIPGNVDKNFAEVVSVGINDIGIGTVTTVSGICSGLLNQELASVTDFTILETRLQNQVNSGNIFSSNDSLYSVFPKLNIESVDLENANLSIRRSFSVTIDANGDTSTIAAGTREVFLNFEDERYSITRSDGRIEPLSSSKFVLSSGNQNARFIGLSAEADANATLVATLRKTGLNAKVKVKSSNSTLIDKSSTQGSGTNSGFSTTFNDGLTYGNYPFGTRVQDRIISLDVPDVVRLYGVFESNDSSDPTPPQMTAGSLDGPNNDTGDLIIGENVTGAISNANAVVITKLNTNDIEFVYTTNNTFRENEVIQFSESGINGIASNITRGSKNVTQDFALDGGYAQSIYDVAKLVRKPERPVPNRKLKAYYLSASYNSSDVGDITTVESYSDFDYGFEIPITENVRHSDLVDCRPRVSNVSNAEGSRSPLEFFGRQFDGDQHSSKDVIANDESITVDYSYYLPRIDAIYLNPQGKFSVSTGAPNDNPTPPSAIPNAIEICSISLPAYLFTTEQAKVRSVTYKRYQMSDISRLESRIRSLEYYTSLSGLETLAVDAFVADENGLNRFKNGVFVDGFSDILGQDYSLRIRNSIDRTRGILRPAHYCTALTLEVATDAVTGIGTTSTATDKRYASILGNNIKRNVKQDGDPSTVITLDYEEQDFIEQKFATRTESVTPFLVTFYEGNIALDPTADIWIDTTQLEVRAVDMMGSLEAVAAALRVDLSGPDGERSGSSEAIWEDWEDVGGPFERRESTSTFSTFNRTVETTRQGTIEDVRANADTLGAGRVATLTRDWETTGQIRSSFQITGTTNQTIRREETTETRRMMQNQRREGLQFHVNERVDTESFGNRIVSREIIRFMRQRNIEFFAKRMRPFTRLYSFFDNVAVTNFCTPKLIEITMVSGTFQAGETIVGFDPAVNTANSNNAGSGFRAELCNINHRSGPRLEPTDIFTNNPYDRDNQVPSEYTAASTILNIDTKQLSSDTNNNSFGHIISGMRLVGQTSQAQATVSQVRLITDRVGGLIGAFEVPNSDSVSFENGRNVFRMTSSSSNSRIPGTVTTSAQEPFYSQGDADQSQEVTLSLRNAVVDAEELEEEQTIELSSETTRGGNERVTAQGTQVDTGYRDPLAQTFTVDKSVPDGVFVTGVDLYFQSLDFDAPVEVELREVELGLPVSKRLAGTLVVLQPGTPDNPLISTSDDASVPHTVTFDYPIHLNPDREYALVLLSNVPNYRVWISRLGEIDVGTINLSEGSQTLVSTQTMLGSLFKSQLGSTWTPSQYEDLKFTLKKASFVPSGTVTLFNPDLPRAQEVMIENPVSVIKNEVRVGIATTLAASSIGVIADDLFAQGVLVTQSGNVASGELVSAGASITSALTITNAGFGYTPSSGQRSYDNVSLTSVTGTGSNATADITINGGVAIAATVNNGGSGYFLGDVLTALQIGTDTLGSGVRFSVGITSGINELTLTNVQGEFVTTPGHKLFFQKAGFGVTELNYAAGGNIIPSSVTTISDGLHMKIRHKNHGMNSNSNIVQLSGLQSDVDPVSLNNTYPSTASTGDNILVSSVGIFTSFENVAVAATNPGYIKIGNEILSYTGTLGSNLTGIGRGVDGTIPESHSVNDAVFKYELSGVSLRRINTQHNLNEVTVSNPISLDSYHVKVGLSTNGTDRTGSGTLPALKFTTSNSVGGKNGRATYNLPFSLAIPSISKITPTGTTISAQMRTISETSVSGNESPFIDQGFEDVNLNNSNYFDSLRMVSSRINETTFLSALPGSKSLTLNLEFATQSPDLSPVIDLDNASMKLISNRVNSEVSNFATDFRVATVADDPSNFIYVTKRVDLANPSTALKVIFDAYLTQPNDIRVFYALNQEVPLSETVFIPFPGFGNVDSSRPGVPIDPAASNGTSDVELKKTDSFDPNPGDVLFREMQFTADKLPSFNKFRIKIVGTSTNQAIAPLIKNLRVLSLA